MKLRNLFLALHLSVAFAYSQVTPTPSPTVSPLPTSTPLPASQTIADLQVRLRQSLARPELRRGTVGVKIVSLNSGKVVLEENAEKYFMPASNMKSFTVAAALERFGSDHRFITSIYAPSMPDSDGTVKGDLRIFGRGDVSMSTRFNGSTDPMKSLDPLVEKIIALGIKKIEGDIVGDDSYFRGFPIPESWEWDDLQWSSGTEVSALPINDSWLELSVKPGPSGYACTVKITPYNPVMRVVNRCTTTPSGPRALRVHKKLDQNILEITGTMSVGDGGYNGTISVSRPAELFAFLLKQRLVERGIVITGNYRADKRADGSAPTGMEIGKIESASMSAIAAQTMKPSQNMYAEVLLWSLGENSRERSQFPTANGVTSANADSSMLGISVVKGFLTSIGIAPDGVLQYDGSGLSRHNLVTPAAVAQLYLSMAKQSKNPQAWRESLTIGGVDGTLRNRFRGTRATGNVRGKTGTILQVSALSGYVKTGSGEELVFSIVVNGVAQTSTRTGLIDDMVNHLANFTGKVD